MAGAIAAGQGGGNRPLLLRARNNALDILNESHARYCSCAGLSGTLGSNLAKRGGIGIIAIALMRSALA